MLAHRVGLMSLIALSTKFPRMLKTLYFYETLAVIIDNILPLTGASDVNSGLLFLQMLTMNTIIFLSFYYDVWLSIVAMIVQVICVTMLRLKIYDDESRHVPAAQVILLFATMLAIMLYLHKAAMRVALWVVNTTVAYESNISLLNTVKECIILVDEENK